MTLLLMTALRTSVIIAVGLLACLAARRRSAAWRHAILTATLGAALLAMPVSLVVPAWTVSVPMDIAPAPASQSLAVPPEATVESPGIAVETRTAEPSTPLNLGLLLLWIWIAGCVAGYIDTIRVAALQALANSASRPAYSGERCSEGACGAAIN